MFYFQFEFFYFKLKYNTFIRIRISNADPDAGFPKVVIQCGSGSEILPF